MSRHPSDLDAPDSSPVPDVMTQRRRERLQVLVDRARDIILIMQTDGRLLDVNVAAESVYGYSLDEFLKLTIHDLRAPETVAAVNAQMEVATTAGILFETVHRRKDGTTFPVEVSAQGAVLSTERIVVSIVRDISERRSAEAALRLRDRALEASSNGIVITESRGVDNAIIYVNAGYERMTGYSFAEIVGRDPMFLRNDEPEQPGAMELHRAMSAGQPCQVLLRNYRKDGQLFWNELSVSPVRDASGVVTHWIGVMANVTDRRQIEESVVRAKEAAESASRAKTAFLSSISHELRTPLHAILGFGRVLAKGTYGALNDRQQAFLRDIVQSGEHMLGLVNDLLDLRRLEERQDSVAPAPESLASAVDHAVGIIRSVIDEKGHSLEIVLSPDTPFVLAERGALVRIFINLLSNAARYTPAGGRIIVRAYEWHDQVAIDVQDSGIGIAPEDQARLFNYFEQVGAGSDRYLAGGSGLGLALTRALVERLGGAITVRSEPGLGSTFTFTLPKAEVPDASIVDTTLRKGAERA